MPVLVKHPSSQTLIILQLKMHLSLLLFSAHLRWALWVAILFIWSLAIGIYLFIQHIALVESAIAATAVSAWAAHTLIIGLLVIWWASTLAEAYETRFDQVLHALPCSRTRLLAVRFFSWWAAGILIALLSTLVLIALQVKALYAWQWGISFALELAIVLALVLFYANLSTQPPIIVLATLLTYLFLRLLPYMEALAQKPLLKGEVFQQGYQGFFQHLSNFLPNLKPFAASDILINGINWQALGMQALTAVLFTLFILALANFDLNKRTL